MSKANKTMPPPADAGQAAQGARLDHEMQRAALAIHEARMRARGLATAIEDAWRAHQDARREAERAGLQPPLI